MKRLAFVPAASNSLRPVSHGFGTPSCQCRNRITTVRASTTTPPTPKPKVTPLRIAAATAYVAYLPLIFGFSVGAEPGTPAHTAYALQEAIDLSLNFAFVTPLVFPKLAPQLSPALEGLFNFVVAWAALLFGFLAEDTDEKNPPYRWVAYATLFLTNIIYLPYLVIRAPRDALDARDESNSVPNPLPAAADYQFAESCFLPKSIFVLAAASAAWFAYGRPEFGPVSARLQALVDLANTDVLAHSLMLDMMAFVFFQGALVRDDANRRNWNGPECDTAIAMARFVPFFGLVYYLLARAELAPLKKQL